MSDESALLAAIITNPDEDMPRLIYADWLDEHDSPIQADFIRTECRLSSCSPAHPEYPDLLEHHAEAVARFRRIVKLSLPKLPPAFAIPDHGYDRDSGTFRRGFLHVVGGTWDKDLRLANDKKVQQFCAGLPQLITTTTARQLWLMTVTDEQLKRILTTPGAEELRGLGVRATDDLNGNAIIQAFVAGKAVSNLQQLSLMMDVSAADFARLAGLKLDRLVDFDLPSIEGNVRDLSPVFAAKWFQGLRTVHTNTSNVPAVEVALLSALAKLPHLETLHLCFRDAAMKALGSPRGFRSLGRLVLWTTLTPAAMAQLAEAPLPQLADLELQNITSPRFATLMKSPWFSRLRVLRFQNGDLNDKAILALSKSPVAAALRMLHFKNYPLGKTMLATIGDGSRFPNLTTLELNPSFRKQFRPSTAVKFAKTLSLPRIRHLDLREWPLGDDGAISLAANPSLANLTRLLVSGCNIGEKGFTALARSPHLQQLIELDLTNNNLSAAAALRDKKLLPQLAVLKLSDYSVSNMARRKLRASRRLVFE